MSSKPGYALLQDVLMDDDFPELDLALRRGRHVDRDDGAWYALLSDGQELLEPFYRRYGCELIHKTDGYYYLLPTGDKISRKQLAVPDMIVGQALALLYLDPAQIDRGGYITHEELVSQLSTVLGSDALIAAFHTAKGKRKRVDERIAQRNVRKRVAEAVRRLATMGFVEVSKDGNVRLRAALMRFAEPVRGMSEPAAMLEKLVQQGEVVLAPDEQAEHDGEDAEGEALSGEAAEGEALSGEAAEGGETVQSDAPASFLAGAGGVSAEDEGLAVAPVVGEGAASDPNSAGWKVADVPVGPLGGTVFDRVQELAPVEGPTDSFEDSPKLEEDSGAYDASAAAPDQAVEAERLDAELAEPEPELAEPEPEAEEAVPEEPEEADPVDVGEAEPAEPADSGGAAEPAEAAGTRPEPADAKPDDAEPEPADGTGKEAQ